MRFHDFKISDFLESLKNLESCDINLVKKVNQTLDFFSYQHFYVIYCKFWELDSDHDMKIDHQRLSHYDNATLTPRIVQRIASGYAKPLGMPLQLLYKDFIWFIMSVEDKSTIPAIEYWFRCLDINGDGVISLYEIEYFFEEQRERMASTRPDVWKFRDFICSMSWFLTQNGPHKPFNPQLHSPKRPQEI